MQTSIQANKHNNDKTQQSQQTLQQTTHTQTTQHNTEQISKSTNNIRKTQANRTHDANRHKSMAWSAYTNK